MSESLIKENIKKLKHHENKHGIVHKNKNKNQGNILLINENNENKSSKTKTNIINKYSSNNYSNNLKNRDKKCSLDYKNGKTIKKDD